MSDEKKQEANTAVQEEFVDSNTHLWEYYDNGKLVSSDEYAKGAHASYFTA